jgi:hypothetical protein
VSGIDVASLNSYEFFELIHYTYSPGKEFLMARCEVCGNDYYLAFEVITAGNRHVFDCFECAVHKLAPVCAHCGCKIIGHGIEAKENYFCCANCAKLSGVEGVVDHVWGDERAGMTGNYTHRS